MNLLLLDASDFISPDQNRVRITGRRLTHLRTVLKSTPGSEVKAGMRNGKCGTCILEYIDSEKAELTVTLTTPPPPPLPLTLICALPRPKSLKKALITATTLGIKNIWFIGTWRVEKSYWQSPVLAPEALDELIVTGLEQARDTTVPELLFRPRFKPFVEDELPSICTNREAFVAHPYNATSCPFALQKEVVLVIGPEGGFIPYEIQKLEDAGCRSITIGDRILRVETAIAAFAARFW